MEQPWRPPAPPSDWSVEPVAARAQPMIDGQRRTTLCVASKRGRVGRAQNSRQRYGGRFKKAPAPILSS